jgi:sulfur-oxidizing protein SoxY
MRIQGIWWMSWMSASLAAAAAWAALCAAAGAATLSEPPGPLAAPAPAAEPAGDPYGSLPWEDMQREYLGPQARVVWDARVRVQGPAFAEDPMNVPISVQVDAALGRVEQILILVDRNPIRRVLAFFPLEALPALAFRFKLEQASPVRAAVRTADGLWHVGSTWVESAGGGCTVSGATRKDGSWAQTLGEVSGRLFTSATPGLLGGARLRLRVMHPQDTGLVGGVPAFYVNQLSVRDGAQRELARILSYEPVSENPVFSFDFAQPPTGGVQIVGTDNNGNRIASRLESLGGRP